MEIKKSLGGIFKNLWIVLIFACPLVYVYFIAPSMTEKYAQEQEQKQKEKKKEETVNNLTKHLHCQGFEAKNKDGEVDARIVIVEPGGNGTGFAFFEKIKNDSVVEKVMREYTIDNLEKDGRIFTFAEGYKCIPSIKIAHQMAMPTKDGLEGSNEGVREVGEISCDGSSILKGKIKFDFDFETFDFDGDGRKYTGKSISEKDYKEYKNLVEKTSERYQELKVQYEKELNN